MVGGNPSTMVRAPSGSAITLPGHVLCGTEFVVNQSKAGLRI